MTEFVRLTTRRVWARFDPSVSEGTAAVAASPVRPPASTRAGDCAPSSVAAAKPTFFVSFWQMPAITFTRDVLAPIVANADGVGDDGSQPRCQMNEWACAIALPP